MSTDNSFEVAFEPLKVDREAAKKCSGSARPRSAHACRQWHWFRVSWTPTRIYDWGATHFSGLTTIASTSHRHTEVERHHASKATDVIWAPFGWQKDIHSVSDSPGFITDCEPPNLLREHEADRQDTSLREWERAKPRPYDRSSKEDYRDGSGVFESIIREEDEDGQPPEF